MTELSDSGVSFNCRLRGSSLKWRWKLAETEGRRIPSKNSRKYYNYLSEDREERGRVLRDGSWNWDKLYNPFLSLRSGDRGKVDGKFLNGLTRFTCLFDRVFSADITVKYNFWYFNSQTLFLSLKRINFHNFIFECRISIYHPKGTYCIIKYDNYVWH